MKEANVVTAERKDMYVCVSVCVLTLYTAAAATGFIMKSLCERLQRLSVGITNQNICNTEQEEGSVSILAHTVWSSLCVVE